MRKIVVLIAGILLFTIVGLAQTAPDSDGPQHRIVTERLLVGDQTASQPIFLLSEVDGVGKVVKDAPYTATATTETTQVLSDGNRIVNKTTAFLARDSDGRTRREESMTKIGNLQAETAKAVMISDPVAHLQYMSQPGSAGEGVTMNMAADKLGKIYFHRSGSPEVKDKIQIGGGDVVTHKQEFVITNNDEQGSLATVKHESLGTQVIEGMNVEGNRDTRTIPAGAIGNEKPIVITSETWTSPDLQVVVLSKRNDPRFGETVYKLTEITRSEPDATLFHIPSDARKDLPK